MMDHERWNTNFFEKRKYIAWRAEPVCDQIINLLQPKSVADAGCGIGEFLAEFKKRGAVIQGIEGTEEVRPYLICPQESVIIRDLTSEPLGLPVKFDLAMCFMVIDAIPSGHWQQVARFLADLSDTVMTVVVDQIPWAKAMRRQKYYEDTDTATAFIDVMRPWLNHQAIRSFQYTQIFRRR